MNAIETIKAHLETTDLKDKLATLKEDDLEDMMLHINDKAQKEAIDGVACIEDNDVFGWAYEWVMNFDPNKPKEDEKEVETKPKAKAKPKTINKPKVAENKQKTSVFDKPVPKKKTVIEHKEDGTGVTQTDLFGWVK